MSIAEWYVHKAEQCIRLAAETVDPRLRTKYAEEAILWRQIARDMERQDRAEAGPP